ncbi:MAG: SPOR domain-containing protein [Bacteroidota bacterium]
MNKYIAEILREKERVIIPDFGSFMRKKDTEIIYFNEYLKFNDNVLIDLIVQKENIEKNSAEIKVKEFVSQINNTINSGQKYIIEGIGLIFKDENGKVKFELQTQAKETDTPVIPDDSVKEVELVSEPIVEQKEEIEVVQETNISDAEKDPIKQEPDIVQPEEIKDSVISETISEQKTEIPIVAENLESVEKNIPARKKEKSVKPPKTKVKKEKKTGKKSKWWLWLIIIIVVIFAGAIGFALLKPDIVCGWGLNIPYINCDKENTGKVTEKDEKVNLDQELSVVDLGQEEKDSVVEIPADTSEVITSEVDTEEETTVKVESVEVKSIESESSTQTTSQPNISGKKYYLVAGCFKDESNADKLIDKLKTEGYNPTKFGKVGNMHGVCYNYFETKKEAENELAKLKDKAWILYK